MVEYIVPLPVTQFYMLIGAAGAAIIFFFILVLMIKFTPAKPFLKAWITRTPVFRAAYRTGFAEFLNGRIDANGMAKAKGIGPVQLTENSQYIEKNSKCAVYEMFAEYGATIPKEYAAILQELRERGIKIRNYDDYRTVIELATDSKAVAKYLEGLKGEDLKNAQKKVAELQDLKVELKKFKSYAMHDMAFMFPNNISPLYTDAIITTEVMRERKNSKLQKELLIVVGVTVFIILIGVAIYFNVKPAAAPAKVVCEVAQKGVEYVVQNITQNVTM